MTGISLRRGVVASTPWIVGVLLTTAIALPWFLHEGFLFLLDFVWAPTIPAPLETNHFLYTTVPYAWLFWISAHVVSAALVQKVAFSLTIALSCVGMIVLVRSLLKSQSSSTAASLIPAVAAGIFYTLNPFAVTRLLMGQFYFFLGYALTPWMLVSFHRAVVHPTPQRKLVALLGLAMVLLASPHHSIVLAILLGPLGLFWLYRGHRRLFLLIVALLVIGALASPWLLHESTNLLALDLRGPLTRTLQAPASGNLLWDALTLTATWKTDLLYLFPYEVLPGFFLWSTLLLGTMGVGLWSLRTNATDRLLRFGVVAAGAISIVLAIGVASPLTKPFALWLYQSVPFWIGMRDSAKFLAVLALGESVLLAYGIAALQTYPLVSKKRHGGFLLRSVLVGVPLACVMALFLPTVWGFSGQVLPASYPESWQSANAFFGADTPRPRVLFLPWHEYMPYGFTGGRTVGHPGPDFFTNADLIAGDNSEVGGNGVLFIATESHRPISLTLEPLLAEARGGAPIAARLASLGFQYVILAMDTPDAGAYEHLADDPRLRLVSTAPDLTVWAINPSTEDATQP